MKFGCNIALALVASTIAFAIGCAQHSAPASSVDIQAPAHARSVAQIDSHRIAVLSDDRNAKTIHIVSLSDGKDLATFGVAIEATAVGVQSPRGPIVVAIGARRGNKRVGAYELWTLAGKHISTVPLPAPALGITETIDGSSYLLMAAGDARSAMKIGQKKLRAIPLPARTQRLHLCAIGAKRILLGSGGAFGAIYVADPQTGAIRFSSVHGEEPACIPHSNNVFALSSADRTTTENHLIRIVVPELLQAQITPTAGDARLLLGLEGSMLLQVNAGQSSSIRLWNTDALEHPKVDR